MRHPIPRAALDDRLGFIGTSGSGKSYNAGTAVEILLSGKARVVIIDPLGVWWGLRLLADGKKPSPFSVAIFGGPHGDLPLTEHAGALIGETAATMAESCIIDLKGLKSRSAERRFMVAFLDALYRTAPGEPFHLVVDEADLFAPQKPQKGDEVLLGHMENIVRRGRVMGFIPWLISQRPAVLNKNVLSQVDGLLAFKLTGSQDRDALDAWIEGQADRAQGKAIKDSLPALQIGEGVIWIPGRGILDAKAKFPAKVTFDSSRTPKRGEKKRKSHSLKPLNLSALKDKLATVEAEQKADDPKALRAEIAGLKAERHKLRKTLDAGVHVKSQVVDKEIIKRAEERGQAQALRASAATIRELRKAIEAAMKVIVQINAAGFDGEGIDKAAIEKAITAAVEQSRIAIERQIERRNKELGGLRRESSRIIGRLKDLLEQDVTIEVAVQHHEPFTIATSPKAIRPASTPTPMASGDGSISLTPAKQRILDAIAWAESINNQAVPKEMVAFLAGTTPTSSAYQNNLGALRTDGFIVYPSGGLLALTEQGRLTAALPNSAPTHEAIMEKLSARLPPAQMRIVQAAALEYPSDLAKDDLADRAGTTASSSAYQNNLGRLRTIGVLDYPSQGRVRATDNLFPGGI